MCAFVAGPQFHASEWTNDGSCALDGFGFNFLELHRISPRLKQNQRIYALCFRYATDDLDTFAGTALLTFAERAIEVECRANLRKMSERLREISKRLALRTGLFSVEAEMVGVIQHAFKEQAGFVEPIGVGLPRARERFDKPEGAHVECAFLAWQAIDAGLWGIAVDKAVADEAAVARIFQDRLDGRNPSWVGRRHEKYKGHDERAGVEIITSIILREGVTLFVPSACHDLLIDGVALGEPPRAISWERALLGQAHTTIESDPVH